MNKDLVFNDTTLEYSNTSNKKYHKNGQEYTLKSILSDFTCKEILRIKLGDTVLVMYNHAFKASANMYFSYYSCVMNRVEVGSAVVAHLIKPWKIADKIEAVNVYASYTQNKFDVKMLTLCLTDTMSASNISGVYSDEPVSILVRLHSTKKGIGRILAKVLIDDVSRFMTHPRHLWLESSGYCGERIDNHLGLLIEPTGKSDKLDAYYAKLGFKAIDRSQLNLDNGMLTLKDKLSNTMYLNLDSAVVRRYNYLINKHRVKNMNSTFRKHIGKKDKEHLLANMSEEW